MLTKSPSNSQGPTCRDGPVGSDADEKGTGLSLCHRRGSICSPPRSSAGYEPRTAPRSAAPTDGPTPVECSYGLRAFAGLLLRSKKAQELSNCDGRRGVFAVSAAGRAKIVDRFVALLNVFRHSEVTLFRAVQLLDRFLDSLGRRAERRQFQLASVAALRLAAKLEETKPVKLLAFLDKSVREKFSKEELIQGEFSILRATSFAAGPPTEVELLTAAFEPLGLDGPADEELRRGALALAHITLFCLELRGFLDTRETTAFCIVYVLRARWDAGTPDGGFSEIVG